MRRMKHSWVGSAITLLAACASAQDGRIQGFVRGPLGKPVIAAKVVAYRANRTIPIAQSRTDADGMYVLNKVPRDSYIRVCASAPGMTTGQSTASLSAIAAGCVANLRLWQAGTVTGRVVDHNGDPVANAEVLGAKDNAYIGFTAIEVKTDDDGRFKLKGLPIGNYDLRIRAKGFEMCEHRGQLTKTDHVELNLNPGHGVQIRIRVKGLHDKLEVAPHISIYPTRNGSGFRMHRALQEVRLSPDGTATFQGLPVADWHLRVSHSTHAFEPRRIKLEKDKTKHEVVIKAVWEGSHERTVLEGLLRSSAGDPLPGQTLIARTRNSQSMNGGRPGTAVTDENGRFSMLTPFTEGERFTLHLQNSNWVIQQEKIEDMTGMSDPRFLVRYEGLAKKKHAHKLTAVRACFVSGRVVNGEGRPVPYQRLTLDVFNLDWHPFWSTMAYTHTDKNGAYRFPGVLSRPWDLRVESSGPAGLGHSKRFKLMPGTDAKGIAVVVRPNGKVRGKVLDDQGKPVIGTVIVLRNYDVETGDQSDGSWSHSLTDLQGEFCFDAVEPGGHRVDLAWGDSKNTAQSEVFEVHAGKTVIVDIH